MQATIGWERGGFLADSERSGWTAAAAELAWWIFAGGRRRSGDEQLAVRDGTFDEIIAGSPIPSKSGVGRARDELVRRGVLTAKTIYRGGRPKGTRWRVDVGAVNAILAGEWTDERCPNETPATTNDAEMTREATAACSWDAPGRSGTERDGAGRSGTVRDAEFAGRSGNQRPAPSQEFSVPHAPSLLPEPEPDPLRTIKTRSTRTRTPEPDPGRSVSISRRAAGRPGRLPNPFSPGGRPIDRAELGDPQRLEVLYAFAVEAGRVPECEWGRLCVYASAAHALRIGQRPERLFGANVASQSWNFTGLDEDQANRWIRQIDGAEGLTPCAADAQAT